MKGMTMADSDREVKKNVVSNPRDNDANKGRKEKSNNTKRYRHVAISTVKARAIIFSRLLPIECSFVLIKRAYKQRLYKSQVFDQSTVLSYLEFTSLQITILKNLTTPLQTRLSLL